MDSSPLFQAAVSLEDEGPDYLHQLDDFDAMSTWLAAATAVNPQSAQIQPSELDLSDLSSLSESEGEGTVVRGGRHRRRNAGKRLRKKARVSDAVLKHIASFPSAPTPTGPHKRNRKKNRRRAARIEEKGHRPRAYTITKIIQNAESIPVMDFDIEQERPSAKGAYTARVKAAAADHAQIYQLPDLLELGFQHIAWDGQ